jgi:NADH:ubiquinone oxidoreductase subunit 5 (subunit L)/multisubunit Na+/H+ antiporter MnhA subunit
MEWQLITITASPVTAAIILDPEGLTYLRVVLFISSNVIKFRKFYMAEDIFINRFTILVVLFVLSIRMLILIPNLIILLLG